MLEGKFSNTKIFLVLYADGCASVVVNGDLVAQGSQFSLKDVELVVAQIELDAVSDKLQASY